MICKGCKRRRRAIRNWWYRVTGVASLGRVSAARNEALIRRLNTQRARIDLLLESGALLESNIEKLDEVTGLSIKKLSQHNDDLSVKLDAQRNALRKIKDDINNLQFPAYEVIETRKPS